MASITKTLTSKLSAIETWKKISNFGAADTLLDMIETCNLDGDTRTCGFANGITVKEQLIASDQDVQRMSYTVTEGPMPFEFHLSSLQVFEHDGVVEVIWNTDVKPDQLAEPLSEMIDHAAINMEEQFV